MRPTRLEWNTTLFGQAAPDRLAGGVTLLGVHPAGGLPEHPAAVRVGE